MGNSFKERLEKLAATILNEPDKSSVLEEEKVYVQKATEEAFKQQKLIKLKERNTLAIQNREERKKYAGHIFIITCIWTTLIFFVIIAASLKTINKVAYFEFKISDSVLITLITSTTVNFFGFFYLVVRYLFNTETPSGKDSENKDKITGMVIK